MDSNKTYTSPFTWRYGSNEMRFTFSEQHKYELWRKVWIALAEGQHKAGLISKEEFEDLQKNEKNIDISRILELEKETKHDVFAAIKEFAEKARVGGGKIHLGATSMDINDNADILRYKEALHLTEKKVKSSLKVLSEKITQYAETPCMAYTHLQPAEPTTVGYRFAMYAQDLLLNLELLRFVDVMVKGKGIKGAVGTAASYTNLLKGSQASVSQLEQKVMEKLGIDAVLISSQVYPRHFDYLILTALAATASSMAKAAADIRILQSPLFGEWSEPFGKTQVGSSAMPFKKNPINSEKICSLARYISQLPPVALENASLSYLERTLDDSANRRFIMPEAFLALDEILITFEKLISNLVINTDRIAQNLATYAPFAATEAIMMEATKKGANRQEMHDILKNLSMQAWSEVQKGKENTMKDLLLEDKTLTSYVGSSQIPELLDVTHHVGDAAERALKLVENIKKVLD